MERRIVAQLQTCMDSLNSKEMREKPVMIIGATNRPDALDSALRRAGRFDREICLGIPDETARCAILKLLTRQMQISGSIDYEVLAAKTPGYVGADLSALTYPCVLHACCHYRQEGSRHHCRQSHLPHSLL